MSLARTNSVHIAVAGVLAGMIACADSDNRTASLTPSPAARTGAFRLLSIMPGSGATLTVQPCPAGSGYAGMCVVDQVSLTFDAEFRQDVGNLLVSASFYRDPSGNGRWCAGGTTTPVSYGAGSRVVFTVPILSLGVDEGLCPLPTTTTTMWISLYEVPGYDSIEGNFPVTYTFVAR